jgi:hypothetical protein
MTILIIITKRKRSKRKITSLNRRPNKKKNQKKKRYQSEKNIRIIGKKGRDQKEQEYNLNNGVHSH